MTLKSIQPDDWPDRIHANKAVIRFPNGVESGNWQTKPADDTCEYVRALPAASAEDVRAAALREALEAMRGAGSAGRTKAEKKSALEQYCLDRDAILALIPEAKP